MTNEEYENLLHSTAVNILHLCGDNQGPGSEAFGDVVDALVAFDEAIQCDATPAATEAGR